MKFMNLPDEYCSDDSYFVILPIAYEHKVTFGKGASLGPKKIIEGSKHLEYYDEQFDSEPFEKGIQVLNELKPKTPEEMMTQVSSEVESHKDNFVIGLGGDHAVTIGLVKGHEKYNEDFGVIVLDAHSDFRDSWNGSELNHACVSKQVSKNHKVGVIGVRSQDIDEAKQIEKDENIYVIKSYDFNSDKLDGLLKQLPSKVYISIDVDVFDPSFIRNTGTPEPGGFSWDRVIEILKKVFDCKDVIGADVVEFSPITNYQAEEYSLAKLAYKIITFKYLQLKKRI